MVTIGGRRVGAGEPCFVVAEAGVNHNGDLDLARRLVRVAAEAGADAVKFQTFRAERVASPAAPKAAYQAETTAADESQLDMLRRLELDWEAHRALKADAEENGLVFLSTPFDLESVELLDRLGAAAIKIGSADIVNVPLLERVGRCGRPVILSTGAAVLSEVEAAVAALRRAGANDIVVLHCVTAYPTAAADANLRAMQTMADRLGLPVGYSDHTEGDEIALAAVAMGACLVEKHFTLDRSQPGPDHRASLEPDELKAFVGRVRRVESALGDGRKLPSEAETANAAVVRRSLAAAVDLVAGTVLNEEMLIALRPGTGIAPGRMGDVVGRTLRRDLRSGELLLPDDLG